MYLQSFLLIAGIISSVTAAPAAPVITPAPARIAERKPAAGGFSEEAQVSSSPTPIETEAPKPPEQGLTQVPSDIYLWMLQLLRESESDQQSKKLSSRATPVETPELEEDEHRPENTTSPITENGITENEKCEALTVIFARGSQEDGNMGSIIGPSLSIALRSILDGNVTIQGVNYQQFPPEDGNLQLGEEDGPAMAKLVRQSLSQCPESKVAIAGYSQGAMIVRHTAELLDSSQVAAAVTFGDPLKDIPFETLPTETIKEFCVAGDPVCLNGADPAAHRSYGEKADEAAQFIVNAAGV